MGGLPFLLLLFGPGILIGILFARRPGGVLGDFAAAVLVTALWGLGFWYVVVGHAATGAEILGILPITLAVAVINAGLGWLLALLHARLRP